LKHIDLKDGFILLADFCIVIICALGIYLNSIKTDLPFKTNLLDSNLLVVSKSETSRISAGDIITTIDGYSFSHWEEIELYLDGKNINDEVKISFIENGKKHSTIIPLTNYYSFLNLFIMAFVGGLFLLIAIIVRLMAKESKSANIFHWACLGLGIIITCTASNYFTAPLGYGYFNRIFWLIAYSFTPVLFAHFTTSFANQPIPKFNRLLITLYSCSVICASVLIYLFINAATTNNLVFIKSYVFFFSQFFRFFLIACILIAISICIYVFKKTTDIEARKRLQWLLFGFFIGPFGFIVFWVIPLILTGQSLIPESMILILLIAMPLSFSIAIIKYRLMDINFIINRSVVYTGIFMGIVIVYIIFSGVISLFISDINLLFPSAITAIAIAFLLQPVKNKIQKFVDKKFFRVEYDYRIEQNRFLNDIKSTNDILQLAEKIVSQTDALIPVDKIGFFLLDKSDKRVRIIANKGWDFLKGRSIKFEDENLKTDLSVPVAVPDKIEPGLNIESADVEVFKRWGMMLVFPIKSPSGIIHAFIALGTKKSGSRFYKDDIDLLNTVALTAALTIDSIKLNEELIIEKMEAERLEELNKIKSFFVSTVTHELKTPLTSIKMFTELLKQKTDLPKEKSLEYLGIIEGESEKLRRLIDNILDFAKIENGIKTYDLKPVNANEIVRKTIESMQYQFSMANQVVESKICSEDVFIKADADAVERVLMNLLSNAIKYSPVNSKTVVQTLLTGEFFEIKVRDEGKGITEDKLNNIFEPFFRIKEKASSLVEGTGLGLAIVKHIMEAHKGKIEVSSTPGKGSTFTLLFPLAGDEKNINN